MRAVRGALVASGAMAGLTKFRSAAVIADEEGPAGFAVVLVLTAFGDIALIDASVVVQQNGRDVQSVGARHAIFAVVAWNG